MRHEHVAWTWGKDMKQGHAAWTCSMDMQHTHEAKTWNMDMRLGHAAWICTCKYSTRTVHGCIRTRKCKKMNTLFTHSCTYINIHTVNSEISFCFFSPSFWTKFCRNKTKHGLGKTKFCQNFAEISFLDETKKLFFGETIDAILHSVLDILLCIIPFFISAFIYVLHNLHCKWTANSSHLQRWGLFW